MKKEDPELAKKTESAAAKRKNHKNMMAQKVQRIDGEFNHCRKILDELEEMIHNRAEKRESEQEHLEKQELAARNKVLQNTINKVTEDFKTHLEARDLEPAD